MAKNKLSNLFNLPYYKNNLNDLIKSGINVLYFFYDDENIIIQNNDKLKLDNIGFKIIGYKNNNDIIKILTNLEGNIFINTFEENQIKMVSEIKNIIGQKTTDNYNIFLNKFLQRDLFYSKYPEIATKYTIITKKEDIDKDNINLDFPIIVKPVGGVQSSGTEKTNNIKETKNAIINIYDNILNKLQKKGLNETEIILEEYIDGKMYTIDYFVDQNQNISFSSVVNVGLGIDYGIDDFCNIVRIISNEVQSDIDRLKLNEFIKKTVDAGGFRNTFIHHEFKITTKGEYKTIETNGRIGGYRVEMYELGNNINILKFPFEKYDMHNYNKTITNNIATFVLYPNKNCKFNGFNQKLISQIKGLKSFYRINKGSTNIGDKIGLTKDGFSKLGTIVIKNKSDNEFEQDLKFINENYFNIIKMQ